MTLQVYNQYLLVFFLLGWKCSFCDCSIQHVHSKTLTPGYIPKCHCLRAFFYATVKNIGVIPTSLGIPYEWIDGHPPAMLGKIACVLMAHQEFDSIPIVPPWYSPQNSIRSIFMYFW